ncbi:CDP-glycerol glycerophosphotransferase family protein [Hellea balneolensis]|uniref:CDP-glycerol glycerophosphotransferase family protein n=1 Tax=Hellea balneolensis TaxID=287478 RepID=UPI000420D1AC|nr:CDP-glycerol glycerophosphotransferase family protein [Hellea balneolensis]
MQLTALEPVEHKTIGLLLLGGIHHILHLIPIAAELEKNQQFSVIIFVTSAEEYDVCDKVLQALGSTRTRIELLKIGSIAKRISPKLGILFRHLKIWKNLDALIVAERTSTMLRHVSKRLPTFIHIPHGAGDRAKSYDKRIRHFDHVLVAGVKDKRRMIERGLAQEDNCHVTGYIKPHAVKRMFPAAPKIFDNNQRTVLYNPHFDEALSSWTKFGRELLSAFAEHGDMNFIFAPHIRLFKTKSMAERKEIEAFSKFENIHIDLGSERSTDMSYTRAANIYIGDVSSQVYEFLSEPKPCIFLDEARTDWQNNPDYAHWGYGPVCNTVEDIMVALDKVEATLSDYAKAQIDGCLAAKGEPDWDPIKRAADAVTAIITTA